MYGLRCAEIRCPAVGLVIVTAGPATRATAAETSAAAISFRIVVSPSSQRPSTQPFPVASNAWLLHSGWTAYWCEPSVMLDVLAAQAHLSPFSFPCASSQPSCHDAMLSGSVTASAYSWPVTIDQPSKTPLPKEFDVAFTKCIPQPPAPTPGQFVFSQGMNAYWIRYGLPSPSTLEVCVW